MATREVEEEVRFRHASMGDSIITATITNILKKGDYFFERYNYRAVDGKGWRYLIKDSDILKTKPKTKFSKLSDKALMVLVKKKNPDAIQEFKNRKIK